ncbi:hypothetical protein T492DRAFT_842924 [Pavlovales sp. CCMP2436]|nr:hypothetical protein T492DRAFT_842924 [Pavlovales sp. CCMP2436]
MGKPLLSLLCNLCCVRAWVGVGWGVGSEEGFRHGLSACLNRPTRSFLLPSFAKAAEFQRVVDATQIPGDTPAAAAATQAKVEQPSGAKAVCISKSSFLALRPLPSPDGLWALCLQRTEQFDEHSACLQVFLEKKKKKKGSPTRGLPAAECAPHRGGTGTRTSKSGGTFTGGAAARRAFKRSASERGGSFKRCGASEDGVGGCAARGSEGGGGERLR